MGWITVVLGLCFAGPVMAQPGPVAEAAFREGKRLMDLGKYAEACPKLEESQRLDPGTGTLLNLGDCYEKLGRTASAWNAFVSAAAASERAGQTGRAGEARRRAQKLEPNLSKVTIQVPPNAPIGHQIRIDGNIATSLAGTAIPVDPGPHTISASAPRHRDWSTTITARPGPASVTATVSLVFDPNSATELATATSTVADEPPPRRGRHMKALTWTLAGASLITLTTGLVIDLTAYNDYRTCRDAGTCPSNSEVDSIERRMLVGDILIGVGIASAAAGLTLYFLSDREDDRRSALRFDVDPRSRTVALTGRF